MNKVGKIYIPEAGKEPTIGTYVDGSGKLIEGVQPEDVIAQVEKLPKDITALEVYIHGPGGIIQVGDQIHDYLESLKTSRSLRIKTIQTGLLASIDTKIWMVGDDRERDPQFSFIVHNPQVNPGRGNAAYLSKNLERILAEEARLRAFYMAKTGLSEAAIRPLMDNETDIDPDQSVDLHFATSIKEIPIMALHTTNKQVGLKAQIDALYNTVFGQVPTTATTTTTPPVAAAPVALDVPLADGKMLVSDAADAASLKGSAVTIDGAAPADGDYPAADGSVVKVVGGKVADVVAAPAAAAPAAPAAKKDNTEMAARLTALEGHMGTLVGAVAQLVETSKTALTAAVTEVKTEANKEMEAKILALRGEIGTVHDPARAAAVYSARVDKNTTEHKGIRAQLKEKEDKRKEQLASR
jgi:ATP-dependent protease ClpP protease subunit